MAEQWIQSAIKRPGALTRRARAAGMSPMAFAREHAHSPGLVGQQARLALTLRRLAQRRGRSRVVRNLKRSLS